MSTTLRDALARQADNAGQPTVGVDELIAFGEARLRRRRVTTVLGSVAAAMVVIALALGATLNSPSERSQEPLKDPSKPPSEAPAQLVRKIVYSEAALFSHKNGVIHVGDRVADTDDGFVHMDVTDDGVVYTSDGGAWFSAGGATVRIGSDLCDASRSGGFGNFANQAVVSANEGSLVAWFECTGTDRTATLVVYDTASPRTMVRRHLALCDDLQPTYNFCTLYGLTRDRVYFNQGIYQGHPRPEYKFDVSTGRVSESTTRMYAEDIRAQSRGLVIGDTWQTGTPTDGLGQNFKVVGSRLVAGDLEVTAKAFDTATGQALRLRLPPGYQTKTSEGFGLFEWLDDDTVALIATDPEGHNGDILTCDLPDGTCAVAVEESQHQGQEENPRRLVPSGPLPG